MSRAWIAFYMGDYDKDTHALSTLEHGAYFLLLKQCWVHGSIPLEPVKRANIAKLTLREWNKIAPTINPYFNDDGTQKRASKEIEKAETLRTKRAMAGQRGGENSGRSRSIKRGRDSKYEAIGKQSFKQTGSPAEAIHSSIISPSTSVSVERGLGKGNLSLSSEAIAGIGGRKQ
jgi:uncharacterized protein YdaU (DUF1376 family)